MAVTQQSGEMFMALTPADIIDSGLPAYNFLCFLLSDYIPYLTSGFSVRTSLFSEQRSS